MPESASPAGRTRVLVTASLVVLIVVVAVLLRDVFGPSGALPSFDGPITDRPANGDGAEPDRATGAVRRSGDVLLVVDPSGRGVGGAEVVVVSNRRGLLEPVEGAVARTTDGEGYCARPVVPGEALRIRHARFLDALVAPDADGAWPTTVELEPAARVVATCRDVVGTPLSTARLRLERGGRVVESLADAGGSILARLSGAGTWEASWSPRPWQPFVPLGTVELPLGGERDLGVLVERQGIVGTVRGRVFDKAGLVAARASVRLLLPGLSIGEPAVVVQTDEDGRFELPWIEGPTAPDGGARIEVVREGHRRYLAAIEPSFRGRIEVVGAPVVAGEARIELQPLATLVVRIVAEEDGAAIPVFAHRVRRVGEIDPRPEPRGEDLAALGGTLGPFVAPEPSRPGTVTLELDVGRHVLDVDAPGRVARRTPSIDVAARGGPTIAGTERAEWRVMLAAASALVGSVAGPSGPVAGAVVVLRDERGEIVREVRADGAGAFRIDGLPQARYEVEASTPPGVAASARATAWVEVRGVETRCDLALAPPALGRLIGRLAEAAEADTWITAWVVGGPAGDGASDLRARRVAEGSSTFELGGLRPGAWRVVAAVGLRGEDAVRAADRAPAESRWAGDILGGDEVRVELVRAFAPPVGRVVGRVVPASGSRIVAGAIVELSGQALVRPRTAGIEADGSFAFERVPEGVVAVRYLGSHSELATASATLHAARNVEVEPNGERNIELRPQLGDLELLLEADGAESGTSLQGVVVMRLDLSRGTEPVVLTRRASRAMRIDGLPAGDWRVEVRLLGSSPIERTIRVGGPASPARIRVR